MMIRSVAVLFLCLCVLTPLAPAEHEPFTRMDVFGLQYVQDPRISPDGQHVVYRRRAMDIMEDRRTSSLWLINTDGSGHIKLTSREEDETQPRWSPDGTRIAFVSRDETHGRQIFMHWVEEGVTTRLTQVERAPSGLAWSPDGRYIAFSSHVPESAPRLVSPPKKPDGANWAPQPRVETRLNYELNGRGTLEYGYSHLFVVNAEGGKARKVTSGDYHHSSAPAWTADGQRLIFSANRRDDYEHAHRDSELHSVDIETGEITQLTDRDGPNNTPVVSPDGRYVAYRGFEDQMQTYQLTRLFVMEVDGSNDREIETELDRSIADLAWDADGRGLYIQYEDHGNTKVGHVPLEGGEATVVAHNLGGASAGGRPYGGGDFTVSDGGLIAMNQTTPYHPGELGVIQRGWDELRMLTDLNGDLLGRRTLGEVEEVWYTSSVDGRDIHGWVVTPPDYDPDETYPLLVELHGGPINNYGDRFSAEVQLYASAGYIVFYPNYRGSTSYGEEFGNLLYHAFPGEDYYDVMSGVDYLIEQGIASEDQLFITGGSAGGTLTAWVIGKTDRFRAAAVQKPVINWISKTLAADNYYAYSDNRYPGWAWENPMEYWERSPISLVGDVETPSLVIVGDRDLRTPTWEARQWYNALKVRGVDAMYVELPGAWHNTVARPSQLIANVDHIVAWLDKYR